MGKVKGEIDPTTGKRKRSPNFTDKEVRVLMKLVFAHIDVIECKKTDSETWRIKDIIWKNIAENFNNHSGTMQRAVETIRQKYDSIKKLARKKGAKNKEEETKVDPDFIDIEDYEKELIRIFETTGNNGGTPTYEPDSILLPESTFNSNIKSETSNNVHNSQLEDSYQDDEMRFNVTDEDMFWELPSDTINRPRLQFLKKQAEQLERDEERLIKEHKYRMRNLHIERRILMNKERRSKAEHQRRMDILDLEIELKQKELLCHMNVNSVSNS